MHAGADKMREGKCGGGGSCRLWGMRHHWQQAGAAAAHAHAGMAGRHLSVVHCSKGRHAGGRRAAGQAGWRAGARAWRGWDVATGGCINACLKCWVVGIHHSLGNAAAAAVAPLLRRGGKTAVASRACCRRRHGIKHSGVACSLQEGKAVLSQGMSREVRAINQSMCHSVPGKVRKQLAVAASDTADHPRAPRRCSRLRTLPAAACIGLGP
jgi:hypothetical protein